MKSLFLIIGAPGSGKSTDASIIAQKHEDTTIHFSVGELLRLEAKSKSKLGKIIEEKINAGMLVPVKIAVETIIKAIDSSNKKIILIDGYPRSVEQMHGLEDELKKDKTIKLKKVIEVQVSQDIARQRVLGRARGDDDKEDIFLDRMKIYHEPLKDIRKFYQEKNLLIQINGEKSVEEVVRDMESKIYG